MFAILLLFRFLLIHRQKSFTLTLYCFAVMLQLIYFCLPCLHTVFAYSSRCRCSISAMVSDDILYHVCIAIYRNTGV